VSGDPSQSQSKEHLSFPTFLLELQATSRQLPLGEAGGFLLDPPVGFDTLYVLGARVSGDIFCYEDAYFWV